MKIGVVTCLDRHSVTDCLSLWALQKALHKRDCYVKIIDIQDKKSNMESPKMGYGSEEFNTMFPNYIKITQKQEVKEQFENIHSCILTGDNVWNAGNVKIAGRGLLLNGAAEKEAFGAGSQDKNYSLFEKYYLKKELKKFSCVAVHSKADKEYFEKICNTELETVCDSSLLLRRKEYDELKAVLKKKEKFLLFDQKSAGNKLICEIADTVSKETGFPIYNVSGGCSFTNTVKENWIDGPGTFLGVMDQAEFVITDNYQTLLYSLIYQRPLLFVNGLEDDMEARDLLARLRLTANYITKREQYKDLEDFKLFSPHTLHKRLEREKEYAYKILDQITGKKQSVEEYVEAPTDILKKDCCGCYACQEICPKDAITMKPDKDGYFFPVVDNGKCINCMLCKKTCVIQNPKCVEHKESYPRTVAAFHKDLETRLGSSSGAIFPALARYIIEEKHGYVAGVCYDKNMNVVSEIADNMEDVKKFYGSKYAKSQLDGSYRRMKKLLEDNQYVLFSGLPCECSALRAFLKKDYEKLYICEIMCHAAPSTKVFKEYVSYLEERFQSKVTNVTFRQKRKGWLPHQTSMVVEFEGREPLRVVNRTNNYYRIFANDLIARESCTSCRFTYLNRAGDLTIGDFWGVQNIHPEIYDNKGTSFVLINNEQGMKVWDQVKENFECIDSTLENVFKKNHSEPINYRVDRDEFLKRMETEPINNLLEEFNDLKN